MEGPTPVSSLIHAATMVTAGIFLIFRFSDFFYHSSTSFIIILLIGSITLFFSSTIGFTQTDIKKVIAYSTCSQLGYMFLSCGFHNYIYSMFHLVLHAFFKALLFLTSGYIIHLLSNEQDIRKMGGLLKIMPFSYILLLIGSYSLIGFPYLAGFYSKEPLMEQ
jgi:NADH-ubiquinone oxidoreductase chain 5